VVTGAGADHATGTLLVRQPAQKVVGAAHLVRADGVRILPLEPHVEVVVPGQSLIAVQRCRWQDVRESLGRLLDITCGHGRGRPGLLAHVSLLVARRRVRPISPTRPSAPTWLLKRSGTRRHLLFFTLAGREGPLCGDRYFPIPCPVARSECLPARRFTRWRGYRARAALAPFAPVG